MVSRYRCRGTVTGREALFGYLSEALVHGGDLAVATARPGEADPAAAQRALADAWLKTPARTLNGMILLGPEIERTSHPGPTERVTNSVGLIGDRRPREATS